MAPADDPYNLIRVMLAKEENKNMPLAGFIEDNLDEIVAEFARFAEQHLASAQSMDGTTLRNGAAGMLRAIVSDMRTEQSTHEQHARSRGEREDHAPGVTRTSQQHARERLKSGFSLDELVAEYRALRASVTLEWVRRSSDQEQTVQELIRFNQAMDQSLTEAVSWFNIEVERARDVFVGVLGHDLRDPLQSTFAAIELLRSDVSSEKRSRAGEIAASNLDRIDNMVAYLLDFTRTRLGGQLAIEPRTIDMHKLCQEIVQAVELTSPNRVIRTECKDELVGRWDAQRLKQAITNLLRNALNYGDHGGPVTLRAFAEDDHVLITVHNVGAPIPDDQRATLFNPLTRGATAQTERSPDDSLGLGLYVVDKIAEAHGGTVEVASDKEHGTTFTLRLPK